MFTTFIVAMQHNPAGYTTYQVQQPVVRQGQGGYSFSSQVHSLYPPFDSMTSQSLAGFPSSQLVAMQGQGGFQSPPQAYLSQFPSPMTHQSGTGYPLNPGQQPFPYQGPISVPSQQWQIPPQYPFHSKDRQNTFLPTKRVHTLDNVHYFT